MIENIKYILKYCTFTWDQNKARINFDKHGIKFETAIKIFKDENIIYKLDARHSNEKRFIFIGKTKNNVLSVVSTIRYYTTIRIISARLASAEKGNIMKNIKIKYDDIDTNLSDEEIKQLNNAKNKSIIFDSDSPELSDEELLQFKKINSLTRNKETISMRISPSTLKKAKRYGKGYTSFLSRLLDLAIDDPEMVKKCL